MRRFYFIDWSSGIELVFFAEEIKNDIWKRKKREFDLLERVVPRVVLDGFGGIDDKSDRLLLPDADDERDWFSSEEI
jgi:hypothetical protein